MKHMKVAGLPLLLTLALSSVAAAAPVPPPPFRAPVFLRAAAPESVRERQSDAFFGRQRPPVAGPSDLLYVANAGTNAITIYRRTAAGNSAPLAVIAGPTTQIDGPGQLSQDAAGNLYVANGLGGTNPSILVFAHGAYGNVAPIRVLAGPLTQIHNPTGLTVDRTTGKIFVFDVVPTLNGASSLLRFPPNAAGNTAPFARSAPNFDPAIELASDASGQYIIEANSAQCCTTANDGITVMAKQFPDGGSPTVVAEIRAFGNAGVADDEATRTYLTTAAGIYRFAENTSGRGNDQGQPASFSPPPLATITSDVCGSQLALGYERNLYVVHSTRNSCPADAVVVYGHEARGNAAPLRVLSGPATQLSLPTGIYEGQ